MKIIIWILGIFLLLNLTFAGITFFLPGQLEFVDSYSLCIEKAVINGVEKMGSIKVFRHNKPDPYTADAISLSELTPYLDEIKPGTLFFSIQGKAASKMFIEGPWKHCGVYIGTMDQIKNYWGEDHEAVKIFQEYFTTGDEYLIFDSSDEYGVAIHSIKDLADLSESSTLRTLLLLEFNMSKDDWSKVLLSSIEHSGKDYDYFYVLDDDNSLYCSEFLYNILPLEKGYFKPSQKILGRDFLVPSDLVHSILNKGLSSGEFTYIGEISGNFPS